MTDDELNHINNYCDSRNIRKSEFIRLCIKYFTHKNRNDKVVYKDSAFKKQLVYETRRFGNNLNQIAHKLNVALKNDDISYTDKLDIESSIEDIKALKAQIKALNILLNKRL